MILQFSWPVSDSHIMNEGGHPKEDMFLWTTEAAGVLNVPQVSDSAIPTPCASSSHQQSTQSTIDFSKYLSRSSWQHSVERTDISGGEKKSQNHMIAPQII